MRFSLGQKILLWIVLIIGAFGLILLTWENRQYRSSGVHQLLQQARGIYHYVVLTRQLISELKGVYIKKGATYKRMTPSAFTAKLTSYAGQKAPFYLKIAVAESSDPNHIPDEFEKRAIDILTKEGKKEFWEIQHHQRNYRFRYAGPLIFENQCQSCHSRIPTKRILGCISIGLDANKFFHNLNRDVLHYTIYMALSLIVILVLLWFMLRSYVLKPLSLLNKAAERVKNEDFSVRVNLNASKEWENVGENFNNMVSALAKRHSALQEEAETAVKKLRKAYEELKRTEKYKSDFFTNITHDLKTPITAMKGAINLLDRKCSAKEATYVEILHRNIEKLSSMVQDLLDCSRLESGELELQLESADLAEVLEDAILIAMPLAWKKKIKLDYQVPDEPSIAKIDKKRIEQVIINLLSNAIKFSPKGQKIEISLSKENSFWKIQIQDHGPGIPKDEQKRVFDKFFHRTESKYDSGMGLGLAIAKGIVEAHGGKIGLFSEEGKGSKFYFLIPQAN